MAIAGEAANPGGAFDALVELEGLSLLNRSGEAPQFVVRRLVQEVTRLRQDLAQEPHELEAALAWINAAFVGDPQDVGSWPVLEPLESHAKSVARDLSNLAALLQATNRLAEAEPMYRRCLEILIVLMPQGYQRQIL